jgi:hypothetical protein
MGHEIVFISFSSNHANGVDLKVCIPLYFRPMVRASSSSPLPALQQSCEDGFGVNMMSHIQMEEI